MDSNVKHLKVDESKVAKKNKVTRIMLTILNLAPIIGVVVFTILFSFVLTDRLEERILHSATTFLLWMFSTLFYIMIMANFKKIRKMIFSTVWMIFFAVLAVIVTPLDRYVNLVFIKSHIGSYVAAIGMFIIFYMVSRMMFKKIR